MEKKTYQTLCEIVYSKSGIYLHDGKEALVSARIGKRLRALNLDTAEEYLEFLKRDQEEIVECIDVISTNVTQFFRESEHFDVLNKIITGWRQKGIQKLRIWCGASSTGEEPYTLAMVVDRALEGDSCNWKILATDISTHVLNLAENGMYNFEKVSGVPEGYLSSYFKKEASSSNFIISPKLKQHVIFRRHNLSQFPYAVPIGIDVIFLRNVMIYFTPELREKVVTEMVRLLRPGGYLFVSHSESLNKLPTGLEHIKSSVYRKQG